MPRSARPLTPGIGWGQCAMVPMTRNRSIWATRAAILLVVGGGSLLLLRLDLARPQILLFAIVTIVLADRLSTRGMQSFFSANQEDRAAQVLSLIITAIVAAFAAWYFCIR